MAVPFSKNLEIQGQVFDDETRIRLSRDLHVVQVVTLLLQVTHL